MFCPKCGNDVKNGAQFCPKCGEKMRVNTGSTKKEMCIRDSHKGIYHAHKGDQKLFGHQGKQHGGDLTVGKKMGGLGWGLDVYKRQLPCRAEGHRCHCLSISFLQNKRSRTHIFSVRDLWVIF